MLTDYLKTPVIQQLAMPSLLACQSTLHVLRADLIHPLISGNKWWKLKYILEDAKKQGKKHLVSFGGAYSNHLLALAHACWQLGFRSTAFVRGEKTIPLNDTLSLCEKFGMQLIYVSRTAYKHQTALFSEYFKEQPDTYYVSEGGYSALAVQGCAEIINSLPTDYDYLFLPVGTGTTLAGLALGIHQKGLKTAIHGIVVLKGAGYLQQTISALIPANVSFTLHLNHHQGGYAKTNIPYLTWLCAFNKQHFLLDPVYTGKMIYAIEQLARQAYFPMHSKILCIHTGGLIGLSGMQDRFSKLQFGS